MRLIGTDNQIASHLSWIHSGGFIDFDEIMVYCEKPHILSLSLRRNLSLSFRLWLKIHRDTTGWLAHFARLLIFYKALSRFIFGPKKSIFHWGSRARNREWRKNALRMARTQCAYLFRLLRICAMHLNSFLFSRILWQCIFVGRLKIC